ncbi:class D beta-lactamase [Roseinatronobacter sp. HJB301]|uniref:Class D beta-lactamase n=1 Tax=Roseinatronobacter alkalisoli TaxID=3028235 RepID=A0ABT5T5E3_9RHOB|nr:class D beta-lactamase [Roseinatronobacter sp. HJB301]MDD7969935.1 class D beta-lactamase [Roseinatronobacter sp. HJB301]
MVCTLVADAHTRAIVIEEGDCTTRVTPASTFKIPLAVMAYDAGVLINSRAPVMQFRSGDPAWGGANWTRDTDPASWMRYSVLWYSQRITQAMGAEALTRYALNFGYGTADFSGDAGFDNGLERAWIVSSLLISPREQVTFLRALVRDALPVRPEALRHAREIVERHDVEDWIIHGKTGTAYPRRPDRSFDYARGWGWYVGWAQQGDRVLVFARLTQARQRTDGSPGNLTRDAFMREWADLVAR